MVSMASRNRVRALIRWLRKMSGAGWLTMPPPSP